MSIMQLMQSVASLLHAKNIRILSLHILNMLAARERHA